MLRAARSKPSITSGATVASLLTSIIQRAPCSSAWRSPRLLPPAVAEVDACLDQDDLREALAYRLLGAIRRAVVDADDREIGMLDARQRLQAAQRVLACRSSSARLHTSHGLRRGIESVFGKGTRARQYGLPLRHGAPASHGRARARYRCTLDRIIHLRLHPVPARAAGAQRGGGLFVRRLGGGWLPDVLVAAGRLRAARRGCSFATYIGWLVPAAGYIALAFAMGGFALAARGGTLH